jgi:tellurite resistance protein
MSMPSSDAPQSETSLEFWRRTPPALFPSMMGFFGLGLAWRSASEFAPFSITPWISYCILGLACLIELFLLSSYISKLSYRPSVILDDMKSVPGRAGVSAITVSIFLFATSLAPISPTVATVALFIALPLHIFTTVLALSVMIRTPDGLVVSPAWHLSFVGFVVASLAAIPLGYTGLAAAILVITVSTASIIYGVSLLQMSQTDMPPPLRPMLAIHLAPISLFATVSVLLGYTTLALVFTVLAVGVAGVLLSATRYLTNAGFSPLWGAFTFPVGTLSVALFLISAQVGAFAWLALVPLLLVSLLAPLIFARVLMMWASGALAIKTGAATA